MCIVETLMAGLTFKDTTLPILGHFHYWILKTHLSIFVPLFIIHKSHKDLATRLKATKNNSPDSFDVHPGTTIFKRRHKLFKNSRLTCALTDGSFFSEIIYWISSSIFWTFRLETESEQPCSLFSYANRKLGYVPVKFYWFHFPSGQQNPYSCCNSSCGNHVGFG